MGTRLGEAVERLVRWCAGCAGCAAVLLWLSALDPADAGAQTGTIAGRVMDQRSALPIADARIEIQGTSRTAATDAEGRYRIADVAPGARTVVARRIGYAGQRLSVTVATEGETTADFSLVPSALTLDEVVVTGTAGAEELRSIGSKVATIDATEALSLSAAPTLGTLLSGRAPGVVVTTSTGRVGAGPAINIRGRSSIGLGNSPLIYIDGVRVDNAVQVGPGGGGGFSAQGSQIGGRLNDIPPEDIERIEIIKGPAASTIYGTEASSGVIQIITKKGAAGPRPQFSLQMQQGRSWFRDAEGRLPTNYAACNAAAILPTSPTPGCHNQAVGTIVTWNALEQEKARGRPIFRSGGSSLTSGSISGARNDVRYYVSGAFERDKGIEPNNELQQVSMHANLDLALHPTVNVSTSVNYVDLRARLGNDIGASAMFATVFGHSVLFPAARGFSLGFTPEITQEYWDNQQDVSRLTASGRIEHAPLSWLRHRLQMGVDYTGDDSRNLERFIPASVTNPFISATTAGGRIGQILRRGIGLTTDYSATATTRVRGPLSQSGSVGLQVFRKSDDFSFLGGFGFPGEGIETVSGAANPLPSQQTEQVNTTIGMYAQEKLDWRNRLFFTAALRVDNNSAFGEDLKWVTYPKVDASWVVSEEPFWRWTRAVSAFRVRAAYGESGRQPQTFSALRTFSPVQGPGGTNAVTPGSYGNPDLRPERGKEFEGGFDIALFDRVNVDVTYFNKKTTDLIINQAIAPSTGFSGSRPMNLGRVDNQGFEISAASEIFESNSVRWDLQASVATNRDEIKDMGGVPSVISAAGQFNQVGYPILGIYSRRVVSADRDPATNLATNVLCDGGAGQAPVACATAPFVFLGTPTPKLSGTVGNTVTLFNNLRLYAMVDFKRGHLILNQNELIRCAFLLGAGMCEENFYPQNFSPLRLAESVGTANPTHIIDQYFEDASFAKLREVSASYTVPKRWVRGASDATISLAARELHTWTGFRGIDPDVNSQGSASGFTGNQAVTPPLTRLVATLNLRF
jgi:TonB-linked SusC/RagA family outer membrane protein